MCEYVSHTGMALPLGPEMILRSWGEEATDAKERFCPSEGMPTAKLFSALQIRTVLSLDPETTWRPSGEKATEYTVPVCPSRGFPTAEPVSAFQNRIVLSEDPETMC